jgi:hypothetical protein
VVDVFLLAAPERVVAVPCLGAVDGQRRTRRKTMNWRRKKRKKLAWVPPKPSKRRKRTSLRRRKRNSCPRPGAGKVPPRGEGRRPDPHPAAAESDLHRVATGTSTTTRRILMNRGVDRRQGLVVDHHLLDVVDVRPLREGAVDAWFPTRGSALVVVPPPHLRED